MLSDDLTGAPDPSSLRRVRTFSPAVAREIAHAHRSHAMARRAQAPIVTLAEQRRQAAREAMAYTVVGQENARRARYRTLRLPPTPLPLGPSTRDAKWLHLVMDGITGPPYLSKVYLAGQGDHGFVRGVFWPQGVRCEIRLPPGAVKNRDRDAVARELAYGLEPRAADRFVAQVAGLSEWLERNMHR